MHSCDDDVMLLDTKQTQENQIPSEGWWGTKQDVLRSRSNDLCLLCRMNLIYLCKKGIVKDV